MISLIVTHYRTPEILKLMLGYFQRALKESGEEYAMIVTDSGTTPETRDMMAGFPQCEYLAEEKNIGYGRAVNKGLRRARGEFLFVANADVIASDTSIIRTLVAYLRDNPRVGIVGPRLLYFNGEVQPSAFRFYSPATILARRTFWGNLPQGKKILRAFFRRDIPSGNEPMPVDWIMGSAFLARADAIKQVGLFDEQFFMYMEDVDWCRRFWEAGWQVMYNPQTTAHHYHFQASKKKGGLLELLTNSYTRVHLQSAMLYFHKYGLKVPRYGL